MINYIFLKILKKIKNKSLKSILRDEARFFGLFGYSGLTVFIRKINYENCNILNDKDIKVAVESDIDESYKDFWMNSSTAIMRLRQGHSLFLLKNEKDYLFYGWVEKGEIKSSYLGIDKFVLPSNVGYVTKLFVPSEHRGQRLSERVLSFSENFLFRNEGINHYFAMIDFCNIASRKIFLRKGYVPLLHFRYFIILGLRLYFVTYPNQRKKMKLHFWNTEFLKEIL